MHFLASIVCPFLTLQMCSSEHTDKLIAAHVIHRHGDRNIYSVYPNDPYKDARYWPGGLGALTDLGKRQTSDLGKFLRRRYDGIIGRTYSDKEMYYRSTNIGRTIESAKSCASGLYSGSLLPQIHTVSREDDYLLFPGAKCARFHKLLNDYLESRDAVGIWKKHRTLIRFIEKKSGKRLRSFADIADIYDILYVEKLKGFNLPKWAKKALETNETSYLVGVHFESFAHTTELKQLKAGYLLDKMLKDFSMKIQSRLLPDRSLWINSAHNLTIAIVLNALNLYDMRIPPYASSLHFELYQRGREYYVQIIFRRSATDNNPRPLHIPNCGTKCPLDSFSALYKHILPTRSFASACKI